MTNEIFELETELEAAQWKSILEQADEANEDLRALEDDLMTKLDKILTYLEELKAQQ